MSDVELTPFQKAQDAKYLRRRSRPRVTETMIDAASNAVTVLREMPPMSPADMKLYARRHAESALRRAAELIMAKDGRVALVAISTVLDRGYGKPADATSGQAEPGANGGRPDISALSDEERAQFAALVAKLRGADGSALVTSTNGHDVADEGQAPGEAQSGDVADNGQGITTGQEAPQAIQVDGITVEGGLIVGIAESIAARRAARDDLDPPGDVGALRPTSGIVG